MGSQHQVRIIKRRQHLRSQFVIESAKFNTFRHVLAEIVCASDDALFAPSDPCLVVRRTRLAVADGSSPHPRQHAVVDEPGPHPGNVDVRVSEPVAPWRHLPHRDVGKPTEPRPAVAVPGLRHPLVESAPRVGKSSTVGREVAGVPDGQRGQPDAEVARIVAAGRAVPRQREPVDDAAAHAVCAPPSTRRTHPPLPTGTRHRRDPSAIAPHIHDDRAALAQPYAQPAP